MRFIAIVPMYNMADWIGDNIAMLMKQTHDDFRCLIGDDISTDNSVDVVRSLTQNDPRFNLIIHSTKKYSLGNICTLIEHAQPDDEDVLVLIDGDDYLANEKVLEKLNKIYSENDCWMTYGSYSDGGMIPESICTPYPESAIKQNRFREVKWRASHLKTFKYKLWKQIQPEAFTISANESNRAKRRALLSGRIRTWLQWRKIELMELLDESGRFARRCSDKAITSPMLEIAGNRSYFVKDILYIYRAYEKDLKFNVKKGKQKWYQRHIRDIIKHKPKYKKADNL